MKDKENNGTEENHFIDEMGEFDPTVAEIAPERDIGLPPSQAEEYREKIKKEEGSKSGSMMVGLSDGKQWPFTHRGFYGGIWMVGGAPGTDCHVLNTGAPVPDGYLWHISSFEFVFCRGTNGAGQAITNSYFGVMLLVDAVPLRMFQAFPQQLNATEGNWNDIITHHIPLDVWVPEFSRPAILGRVTFTGGGANTYCDMRAWVTGELIRDVGDVGRGKNIQSGGTIPDWNNYMTAYWNAASWT